MATLDELFSELDPDLVLTEDNADRTSIVDESVNELAERGSDYRSKQQYAKAKFMQMMAARQREIRREAAQDADQLVELVSRKQLSALIAELTKSDTNKAEKYKAAINRRYTFALRKWIPADLVRCYNRYRNTEYRGAIPRSIGFLHINTPDWGNNYNFWVEPDLPQFIPQYTEQALVQETQPEIIEKVNKFIYYYYQTLAQRTRTEIKLATDFYNIHTRYDLLQLNPDFYKLFMTKKFYEL